MLFRSTIDAEFAVKFIIFNILPLVCFFATKEKEHVTEKIDFDRDVIIGDGEEK